MTTRPFSPASVRRRSARWLGGSLAAVLMLASAPVAAAPIVSLKATYLISISGLTVGRALVEGRFADGRYATAISGTTFGVSRFVSDARAEMAGNGHVNGTRVLPANYNMQTRESGFATLVRMAMEDGAVTAFEALPELVQATDRVPVDDTDLRGVVDPLGAFVVSLDRRHHRDGPRVCNRTVRVFDGWQRFDVQLFYRHDTELRGAYRGNAIVCGARYIPVAGHRPDRAAVRYMAQNKRLEVWVVPIEGTDIMVPYQLVIGTAVGDLMVTARRFEVEENGEQTAIR